MADPNTAVPDAPLAPVLPLVAGLIPGSQTTEYKLARLTAYLAMAASILGMAMEGLAQAQVLFPNAKGIGAAIAIGGMIAKALTSFGYSQSRATVKAAALSQPKGFGLVGLLAAIAVASTLALLLFTPRQAHAQTTLIDPAAAPAATSTSTTPAPMHSLAFELSTDLTLRPNLSVIAFAYDFTHKAYLGQATIAGLYALTSKRLLDAGAIAGGSITFDSSSHPLGSLLAGLVSPKLALSPTLSLHGAAVYARRFGPDAANLLYAAPTLEF